MSPRRAERTAETQDWIAPYIERWGTALVRFGAAYTDRRDMAQDVAQEAFLRLLIWHDKHPGEEVRPGWLFIVARNVATDLLRRERTAVWPEDPSALAPPLEETVVNRLAVRRVLDGMSAVDRECLLLFYFGELTVREIAAQLKISPDSVRTRLHRARKRFSDVWEVRRHG